MCGISVITGQGWEPATLEAMVSVQHHRGPDDSGLFIDPSHEAGLGHNRLSVIDLSRSGSQPMHSHDKMVWIVFNGEVYNYLELRAELADYPFRSRTDTEVVLAAYLRWGMGCLDRLIGMFAFVIWNARDQSLFATRDRFGVKPLFVHRTKTGGLLLASEIKALHAAGVPREPNPAVWATYLASGMYNHGRETFWQGVERIPPGGWLTRDAEHGVREGIWYDPAKAVQRLGTDRRTEAEVLEETEALFQESVRLRFRSDVPVGICVSGGLDSSLLLGLVARVQGPDAEVDTFTFETGDPQYDETPWVRRMLAHTRHPWHPCRLDAADVPQLAAEVQAAQDEPFGGLPTMGMARVFQSARDRGTTVLLDGTGVDEAWAGYEYYRRAGSVDGATGPVQAATSPTTRPECMAPAFRSLAEPFEPPRPFNDPLQDLQYRDLRYAKIPRAMRFNDRVSMMYSREVREPCLDHRIVELGLRQPASRKLRDGQGKWLLRRLAERLLLPHEIVEAPKRPVQTPQREWLRGPIAAWAEACIEDGLAGWGRDWLDVGKTRKAWRTYRDHGADNSFPAWQWISLGLMQRV